MHVWLLPRVLIAPIKKAKRVADADYLAWCRCQRCAFCPSSATQPHHVILKGMGGAQLRDDRAVPVCTTCHKRCHGETVVVDYNGARLLPIEKRDQLTAARAARKRYRAELATAASGKGIPF